MVKVAQGRIAIVAGVTAILLLIGMTQLGAFTGGDQRLIVIVFAVSALAAAIWLALRGMPQRLIDWLVPVSIAFGPAFLLGAYITVIVNYVSSG